MLCLRPTENIFESSLPAGFYRFLLIRIGMEHKCWFLNREIQQSHPWTKFPCHFFEFSFTKLSRQWSKDDESRYCTSFWSANLDPQTLLGTTMEYPSKKELTTLPQFIECEIRFDHFDSTLKRFDVPLSWENARRSERARFLCKKCSQRCSLEKKFDTEAMVAKRSFSMETGLNETIISWHSH